MSDVLEADILSDVINIIESTLKIPSDKIDLDADFESFGINSLIVMELMENIEKEFDVSLTPAQFSDVNSIRGLAELLEGLKQDNTSVAPVTTERKPNVEGDLIQHNAASVQSPQIDFRSPSQQGTPLPANGLLKYITEKYAVDLSRYRFNSLDEVVDTLVSSHSENVLRYYGIDDSFGPEDSIIQRLNISGFEKPVPAKVADIAIVGISCRFPDANNSAMFWENLINERNSMREIPTSRWDWKDHFSESITPGKTISKWGALIDGVDCFDADFFGISSSEAITMDPQQRLLLEETYKAVEDAGLNITKLSGSRTGVFIGYEYSEYEQYLRKLNNKNIADGPMFSSSSPSYYLSNRISFSFDFCGPSESINMNCASSAMAINRAYYSLMNSECDLAVAGGVSLNLFVDDYIASSQYGILSTNGTSGVFDDEANGFTRGEGVAVILLKRLEDAKRENNKIYAVIKSCHQNYRGAARNISEVKHESITDVLSECYKKADVDIKDINYIEVDGYATKWGDSFEYEGIKNLFKNSQLKEKHCALGSLKGNIGNVESVSGLANVIKLALSFQHKKFPATISKNRINSFIDIDNNAHPLYIADKTIPFDEIRIGKDEPIRAGVNSFADSGANVHILLEEYTAEHEPVTHESESKQLFILSAKDSARLILYIQEYIDFLTHADPLLSFESIIYTLQTGRQPLNERIAIVVSSRKELLDKLSLINKTGIKEKLGLESKEIYHSRYNPADKNSLANLITPEMAITQLGQTLQTKQWKQIALLWVNGVSLPWEMIWRDKAPRRISLPGYPFARERFWMNIDVKSSEEHVVVHSSDVTKPNPDVGQELTAAKEIPLNSEFYFSHPASLKTLPAETVSMTTLEKIECFLKQEVARQLQIPTDQVALDKDFIELGMKSMGIADLIIKTDTLLGINLSPSVIFKHPEISSLSDYLVASCGEVIDKLVITTTAQELDANLNGEVIASRNEIGQLVTTPEDILIPLQLKGRKIPIFALPGAGGSALSLQQLSHALGSQQPLYCLEAVGLNGSSAPMTSVEEMARFNIDAIRTVQPKGPYRLLGYSNGGIVAFEMARQILEQGEQVAALMLLDSLSPSLPARNPDHEILSVFKHFVGTLGGESTLTADQLSIISHAERSEFLYNAIPDVGISVPKKQFVATFDVATANEAACRSYQPEKLSHRLDVSLFRASDSYPEAPEDYGWNQFLNDPVRCYDIEANHFTIVEKEAAVTVAKQINLLSRKVKRTS